jgi:peptidoglycan/xylan/chitin deacetylase (PgdA/CDA1 family)
VPPHRSTGARPDAERTSRLLLSGLPVDDRALDLPEVRRIARPTTVPPRAVRTWQRLRLRRGRLSLAHDWLPLVAAARRAVSTEASDAPPRILVRVDEFPHARALDEPRYGLDAFERFHAVLAEAGVPYLLAALPRPSHDYLNARATGGRPLSDEERAVLARVRGEGVTLGLHGLDHRTRHERPRRHSELSGLTGPELERLLDEALRQLGEPDGEPRVFVPPFNRFDAGQWHVLARRFDVVCGGPESVAELGWQGTPVWLGEAVWLPSYAPFYGRAREVRPALDQVAGGCAGSWLPTVLHFGWEVDDGLEHLRGLARSLAGSAASWDDFLEAVGSSAGYAP